MFLNEETNIDILCEVIDKSPDIIFTIDTLSEKFDKSRRFFAGCRVNKKIIFSNPYHPTFLCHLKDINPNGLLLKKTIKSMRIWK